MRGYRGDLSERGVMAGWQFATCEKKTKASSRDPSIFTSVTPIHKHTQARRGVPHSSVCVKGGVLFVSPLWLSEVGRITTVSRGNEDLGRR